MSRVPSLPPRNRRLRHRAMATLAGLVTVGATVVALAAPAPAAPQSGWELTVYLTVVESLHRQGSLVNVTDCNSHQSYGTHWSQFLDMTSYAQEGSGWMTDANGNKTAILGGWDSAQRCGYVSARPLTASGQPAVGWQSAAGDPGLFPNFGAPVRISNCGHEANGATIPASVCNRVMSSNWQVQDRGPAITGKHLDLYIGDEDQAQGYMFQGIDATVDPSPSTTPPPPPPPATTAPAGSGQSTGNSIAVARNDDGRLEMFAITPSDGLVHRWQTSPDSPWTGWYDFGTSAHSVAVGTNANGTLAVFAVSAGGTVSYRYQIGKNGSSGWTGWTSLNGPVGSLAVAKNHDGHLELFAANPNNASVWHNWQTSSGWSGWYAFDTTGTHVAATLSLNGTVVVFVSRADGTMVQRTQNGFDGSGGWSSWATVAGPVGSMAAVTNYDGRAELFVTNPSSGVLWHRWQNPSSGVWSAWYQFDGSGNQVAAAKNLSGKVEVFVVGSNGLFHRWQQTAGQGNWTGWLTMDGAIRA